MEKIYQIVLLGAKEKMQDVQSILKERINEIGIDADQYVSFFRGHQLTSISYKFPVVGIFFGGDDIKEDIEAARSLYENSVMIVPVVESLKTISDSIPDFLHPINGMELSDKSGGLEALSSVILEGLNLLRKTRKLFISYKRSESKVVAIQLYEYLDSCGFDVFLDTVSIRPGDPFQDVLWHKMSDVDVIVLLDTPGFLDSRWTPQELSRASAMSIQILQIVWPRHNPAPRSGLCEKLYLEDKAFEDSESSKELTLGTIEEVVRKVESLRARAIAARYESIVGELGEVAKDLGVTFAIQKERHIIISKDDTSVAVIPAVGIPQAVSYQEVSEWIDAIEDSSLSKAILLYDHRNIRDEWCSHLDWLDKHLPIKAIRVTNSEKWLKNL